MKSSRIGRRALVFALLATPLTAPAAPGFLDLRDIAPIHGDAEAGHAKATVCQACHGAAGIAPAPAFPNLAGQEVDYLYWQLVEFKRAARADSPMTAQVASLDEADMRNLSAYFAALTPAGADSADSAVGTDRGGRLFHIGDPAKGVPPCQGCHGTNGNGHPLASNEIRFRAYPVLRGQHAEYVVRRLKDFRDGKFNNSSNDFIMHGVARTLDDTAMRDLATWLEAGAP